MRSRGKIEEFAKKPKKKMPIKRVNLFPAEAELVRSVDPRKLERAIKKLKLPDVSVRSRPIRLRMPESLLESLETVSQETGIPQVRLLVKAAEAYRRDHPFDKRWTEPGPEYDNAAAGLVPKTFRLYEEERELIRNLGRGVEGVEHRRAALERLVPILEKMSKGFDRTCDMSRVTVKIDLPDSLISAVEKHVDDGHSFTSVLLKAAEEASR